MNNKTVTGSRNYSFKVLGNFWHSRYNTPNETKCTGTTKSSFCNLAGGCGPINCGSTWATNQQALSSWLMEAWENGSGYHSALGYLSREWECSSSAPCPRHMRDVPNPCPKCSGYSVTPNKTVAINPSRVNLSCGTKLFVENVGTVTVTDHGTLNPNYQLQLDHYAGVSGCNRVGGNIGYGMTFQLF